MNSDQGIEARDKPHANRDTQYCCRLMAAANVSDEKQNYSENVQSFYCSLDKAAAIHGQLTFIAVLNAFLSITASLVNGLVLVALSKDSSLHPPSKLLLRSLAVSDLCAGLFQSLCMLLC